MDSFFVMIFGTRHDPTQHANFFFQLACRFVLACKTKSNTWYLKYFRLPLLFIVWKWHSRRKRPRPYVMAIQLSHRDCKPRHGITGQKNKTKKCSSNWSESKGWLTGVGVFMTSMQTKIMDRTRQMIHVLLIVDVAVIVSMPMRILTVVSRISLLITRFDTQHFTS